MRGITPIFFCRSQTAYLCTGSKFLSLGQSAEAPCREMPIEGIKWFLIKAVLQNEDGAIISGGSPVGPAMHPSLPWGMHRSIGRGPKIQTQMVFALPGFLRIEMTKAVV